MAVLEVGTLVELVSGSPRMVIEAMEGQKVHVVWCNQGEVHRDTFPITIIRKAEERKPDGGRGGFGGRDGGRDDRKPFNKDKKFGDKGGFGKKDKTSFRKG